MYLLMHVHGRNYQNVLFQQDNASIHSAILTRDWFRTNFIRVLDWASTLPDLNHIEKVWGETVRDIYQVGKQYANVEEQWSAVFNA